MLAGTRDGRPTRYASELPGLLSRHSPRGQQEQHAWERKSADQSEQVRTAPGTLRYRLESGPAPIEGEALKLAEIHRRAAF